MAVFIDESFIIFKVMAQIFIEFLVFLHFPQSQCSQPLFLVFPAGHTTFIRKLNDDISLIF